MRQKVWSARDLDEVSASTAVQGSGGEGQEAPAWSGGEGQEAPVWSGGEGQEAPASNAAVRN